MTHLLLKRLAVAATATIFAAMSALPASALTITFTNEKLPWEQAQVLPAPVAIPPAPFSRATALRDDVEQDWISVEPRSPLTIGANAARGAGPIAPAIVS